MDFNDFKSLLKRKKATIFNLTFLLVLLVIIFSLLGGLKYGAKSKLLVVQNTGSSDSYSISRSNEYLGNLLSQVVYSGSFFNLAINNPNYKINQDYFSNNYNDRLKIWRKTVSTKTISDTGIIEVNVCHPIPDQARLISLAISDILINKNANYHGGSGVVVSILDQPIVSDYPDQPNLALNFILSAILGLFISLIFVYLYPEKAYDLRLWPKRKEKKKEKISHVNKSAPIKVETDLDFIENNIVKDKYRKPQAEMEVTREDFNSHGSMSNVL